MTDYEMLLEAAVGFREENASFEDFENYYESVTRHFEMPVSALMYWNMARWVCYTYKPSVLLPYEDDLK